MGTSIQTAKDAGGDDSAMAKLDTVLNDAQSTFDKVNEVLLTAAKPKGVESSETEMWSATGKLSDSMKTPRAYIDDEKPSELADHKKQWDTGRAWWNQAVTAIWSAAAASPLQTTESAPTAPPMSRATSPPSPRSPSAAVICGPGGGMWVDDFEGEYPLVDDLDDGQLVEIRKRTLDAMDNPAAPMLWPLPWYLEDQLHRIDAEMARGVAAVAQGH